MTAKLTKSQLQATLDGLAKAHSRAFAHRSKLAEHCMEVYGCDPADVDFDEFIDRVDGGNGACQSMSADDFDRGMKAAVFGNNQFTKR